MAKDKRDPGTLDWVDEDEERRFKEERAMVRRKLRQEKLNERKSLEEVTEDRPGTRSHTRR